MPKNVKKHMHSNWKTTQSTNPSMLLVPDYHTSYYHTIRHTNSKKQQKTNHELNNPIRSDMASALSDSLDALDNGQDVYNPHENNSERQ